LADGGSFLHEVSITHSHGGTIMSHDGPQKSVNIGGESEQQQAAQIHWIQHRFEESLREISKAAQKHKKRVIYFFPQQDAEYTVVGAKKVLARLSNEKLHYHVRFRCLIGKPRLIITW